MQRYLVVLLALISFFSCSKKNSDISIILDKAENCMEKGEAYSTKMPILSV